MDHLEEKYSRHGYLKLWLPCKKNQDGLETLRNWMENGEIETIVCDLLDKNER